MEARRNTFVYALHKFTQNTFVACRAQNVFFSPGVLHKDDFTLVDKAISFLSVLNWTYIWKLDFTVAVTWEKIWDLDFNSGLTDLNSHLLLYFEYGLKSEHRAVSQLAAQISRFPLPSSTSHLTQPAHLGPSAAEHKLHGAATSPFSPSHFGGSWVPPVGWLYWIFRIRIVTRSAEFPLYHM